MNTSLKNKMVCYFGGDPGHFKEALRELENLPKEDYYTSRRIGMCNKIIKELEV